MNCRPDRFQALGAYLGLALLAAAAACSSSAAPSTGSTPTQPGATVAASGPVGSDLPATSPGISPASDDFCHAEITGDVTATLDSGGGFSSISYGPWIPSSAGTIAGIALDDTFFIMNCSGAGGELVTMGTGTDQHLPMAPASYPIRKAENIFGGYDSNPPVIQASPFIGSGDFFWAISADSVFNITEFDASHIAGNFVFYVQEAKSDLITDGLPAKSAVITGTFNLKNPN